jgi:LuxR family maltose regulon positive regulatory protein
MANQRGIYSYGGFLFGKITLKLLEALCRYHIKDIPGAIAALEAAYELESPNGLDMPFIEMGREMAVLIAALLDAADIPREWMEKIRRDSSAYARNISAAAKIFTGGEASPVNPNLPPPPIGMLGYEQSDFSY